jgi:xanthine permease XanP
MVLVVMPTPLKGAILLFVSCFMMVAGLQLITSRMIDARKTFVIGGGMIAGLSIQVLPSLYADIPASLSALASSSLTMTTLVAFTLNLVFRIGVSRHRTLELEPAPGAPQAVVDFMQISGGAWGARPDVIGRATAAMTEFMETAEMLELAQGPVRIDASFDEFNLDVRLTWRGMMLALPTQRPHIDPEKMDAQVFANLSGYLIRWYASSVQVSQKGEKQNLLLHFDH